MHLIPTGTWNVCNSSGSIFLDYRSQIPSRNRVKVPLGAILLNPCRDKVRAPETPMIRKLWTVVRSSLQEFYKNTLKFWGKVRADGQKRGQM